MSWRVLCGAVIVWASGHAGAADTSPWQALGDELRALQQQRHVPALALVILQDGHPALISAAALSDAATFSAETPFRWGSISKTVTALVALEAARRHGAELNQPVRKLLGATPYHNPWESRSPLRLMHLLELTAGLPDLSREAFADNTPLPLETALSRHAGTLLWPPGLQHSYSNVPPGITAAVVERLTGVPFDTAAQRLVFDPLGMSGASYRPVPGLPGGYRADGRTEIPYWHMTFRAFGALNASPAAMARLLEALLDHGRVNGQPGVSEHSVERMFRAEGSLGAQHGLRITYGAGLYGWVHQGHLFYGHGGDADGYRSRFGLLPAAGRGYLLGINVDNPGLLRRLQKRVEDALVSGLPAPSPPPAMDLSTEVLNGFAGRYYPASVRFGVSPWRAGHAEPAHLVVRDGVLAFRRQGRSQRLIPVAAGRFRRPEDPDVSVVFAEQDGVLYLQGAFGNFVRMAPGACPRFLSVCAELEPSLDARPGGQ